MRSVFSRPQVVMESKSVFNTGLLKTEANIYVVNQDDKMTMK